MICERLQTNSWWFPLAAVGSRRSIQEVLAWRLPFLNPRLQKKLHLSKIHRSWNVKWQPFFWSDALSFLSRIGEAHKRCEIALWYHPVYQPHHCRRILFSIINLNPAEALISKEKVFLKYSDYVFSMLLCKMVYINVQRFIFKSTSLGFLTRLIWSLK